MRIRSLRLAFATLASLAFAASTDAAAILQFQQQNPLNTPVLATNPNPNTTVLSTTGPGSTGGFVPVFVTLLGSPTAQPAFMSFTTQLTSGASATQMGQAINQDAFTGTISFNFQPTNAAATNILTVTFTGGLLSGLANGNSATFSASAPPSNVTFSSGIAAIQAAINADAAGGRNFALGLSGLTNPFTITGSTVAGFQASVAGTFSTNPIPEPSSLVMASMAVIAGLGGVGLRRRVLAS